MRQKALAFLMRHFSGKSWKSGQDMVPEEALPHMAAEGIVFTAEGPATYDRVLRLNQACPPVYLDEGWPQRHEHPPPDTKSSSHSSSTTAATCPMSCFEIEVL